MERVEAREGGFRRRPLIAMIVLAAIISTYLLYADVQTGGTSDQLPRAATSKSVSALGLSAFAELLERLKYRVSRTRLRESWASYAGHTVVLSGYQTEDELQSALDRFDAAAAILVVAPKRKVIKALREDRFIFETGLLEPDDVASTLSKLGQKISIEQTNTTGWLIRSELDALPASGETQLADAYAGRGIMTAINPARPYQLHRALVVEIRQASPRILLLTDPDPVSNLGIGKGENALFAIELIEFLAGDDRRIVFDEAFAGSATGPSAFARLFELPWLALTLSFGALVIVIGFAALNRFGTPKEDMAGVAAGRASLIGATARLNLFEDSGRAALARYMRHSLRTVATGRRAPGTTDVERVTWLDKRAGAKAKAATLNHDADALSKSGASEPKAILNHAQHIHAWRTEMLNERD